MTANDLWAGTSGVSNAGKKRGRGKRVGRKRVTDLNRGQVLGTGKANMMWPGLNAPIMKGREIVERKELPANPDYQNQLVKMRDEMSRIRYRSLAPLQRGYSGNRFPGQDVGPPDPIADYTFDDFESRVIEFKLVSNMTGTLGRKMRFSAFVVVGNKKGMAGYGKGKALNGRTAIRVAKNRAAQRLHYFELFENHTVFHNMYSKYVKSKLFLEKKEKGYGLRCHRVISTICKLVGIKDLRVKVEGSTTNYQAVTKGFFQALTEQETHSSLAERTGYHVVEMRPERDNMPRVIASPSNGIIKDTPLKDEEEDLELDFDRLYYGGKTPYNPPPKPSIYSKLPSWKRKQKVVHRQRNQPQLDLMRKAGLIH